MTGAQRRKDSLQGWHDTHAGHARHVPHSRHHLPPQNVEREHLARSHVGDPEPPGGCVEALVVEPCRLSRQLHIGYDPPLGCASLGLGARLAAHQLETDSQEPERYDT